VLESLVDASRFPFRIRSRSRPFTVGRLSRDTPTKHHAEDPALWRALAAEGVRVRIMGGTCLAAELAGVPNIELLRTGAEDPETFLHSLDCFVYRTADTWLEGFGRVVIEAMATGLPVVCGNRGGYVDFLAHRRDSILFTTTAEAIDSVRAIRRNLPLARSLGANASRTAALIQQDATSRTLQLLAGTVSAAHDARRHDADPGVEVGAEAAE
jgi:glycosyltransferase involved in cell wall biosynthesis